MLFGFDDFDRTFAWLNDLHRRIDATFGADTTPAGAGQGRGVQEGGWQDAGGWLRLRQLDDRLEVRADLPGVRQEDLDLTLHGDVLTVTAKRRLTAPEGFGKVHLAERRSFEVTRSVALPVRVDPERVGARLEDGALTITLAKAEVARPRQIAVQRD